MAIEWQRVYRHWHSKTQRLFQSPIFWWSVLAGFWLWALILFFVVPQSGTAAIPLILAASFMPLRQLKGLEQSAWIALLLFLSIVQYRAIRRDRQEYLDEQTRISTEQRQGFQNLLAQGNQDLQTTLKTGKDNMQSVLDDEQANYARMLQQQRGLNQQQARLSSSAQELLASVNGQLLPGNDPMIDLAQQCKTEHVLAPNEYILLVGDNTFVTSKFPHTIVQVNGVPLITVDKDSKGQLQLGINIKNDDGTILVKFDSNGFVVHPKLIKRTPDKSTLLVSDDREHEIVSVRYMNQRTLRVKGMLTIKGQLVDIQTPGLNRSCIGGVPVDVDLNF